MKLTYRQQMKLWLEENSSVESSEDVLGKIFSTAVDYKKTHPNLTLKQLYSYAYMVYLDEKFSAKDR